MVTIITEKLRNQKLDDIQFETISPYEKKSWESPSLAMPPANVTGKKDWGVSLQDSAEFWRSRHASMPQAVYGLYPEGASVETHGTHVSLETPPLCCHARSVTTCVLCESLQATTPPAPPKKRHCRSLSIPGDGPIGRDPTWQPQASSIWRPVAVRSRKSRNSPLALHKGNTGSRCSQGSQGPSAAVPATTMAPRAWSSLSDHFATPPETPSPVPRPASASSGFYDSSQGSLYTAWSDSSTSPNQLPTSLSSQNPVSMATTLVSTHDLFKLRSLSMEEPPSGPVSPASGATAVSMPTLPHQHVRSTPSSPRRQRVPRCRSQPSVLYDRKSGLKRRREDARPTLDLLKMKETALESASETRAGRSHSFTCGGSASHKPQRNVQFAPIQQSHGASTSSALMKCSRFTDPPECFLGLNTIASSPLDSATLPPSLSDKPWAHAAAAIASKDPHDLERSMSPPRTIRPIQSTRSEVREALSDSGCSDTNEDSGDLVGFVDSENDISCEGQGHKEDAEQEEEQFDLEINPDLDLEQIEKD